MTQQQALDILKLGYNAYITGPAGSGKTYLLNQYIEYLNKNEVNVGITASTGIAATHMGGVTIHSWTGLGIKSMLTDYDMDALSQKKYLWKRMDNVKVLIIDEISMLHDFRLDLIDQVMQMFKNSSKPFGGVQLILCGDFFQLPPVARSDEPESHFVYHSASWKRAHLKICYLEEQFRQTDDKALEVLNSIRGNMVTPDIKDHLQKRFKNKESTVEPPQGQDELHIAPTRLYTHNEDVDAINAQALEALEGVSQTYPMTSHGPEPLVAILKKSCLAPEQLRLKKGARVMFVKNNFDLGYVNGTLGEVVSLKGEYGGPIVRISRTGKMIELDQESWKIEEDGSVKAEIKQYPLRLAWAITVHKSQGMSLDAVEVDLSKSFERGMGYVALSRVRTLAGLTILGMNDEALKVNDEVLEYDEELKEDSKETVAEVFSIPKADIEMRQQEYLKKIAPARNSKKTKESKLPTHKITYQLIQEKLSLQEIAEKRGMTEQTILNHLEKLVEEDPAVIEELEYLQKSLSPRHREVLSEAIIHTYEETGGWQLAPMKNYLDANKKIHRLSPIPGYRDIQLMRLFIRAEQA